MATFDVDVEGSTYEVDAPDENTAWQWANIEHKRDKDLTGDLSRRGQAAAGGIQAAGEMLGADFLGAGFGALLGFATEEGTAAERAAIGAEKASANVRDAMRTITDWIPGAQGRNEMADLAAQGVGELIHAGSEKLGQTAADYPGAMGPLGFAMSPEARQTIGEAAIPVGMALAATPRGARSQALPKGISVKEAEALRAQAEAADAAKLQKFRQSAETPEMFPETLNPTPQLLTPGETARRQGTYDMEQAATRQQLGGQGEMFRDPMREQPEGQMPRGPGPMEFTKELRLQDTQPGVKTPVDELPYTGGERRARGVTEAVEAMERVEPVATKEVTGQEVQRALKYGPEGRRQGGAINLDEIFKGITARVGEFRAGMLRPLVERLAKDPIVGAGWQHKTTGDVIGPFNSHAAGTQTRIEQGWGIRDGIDGFVTRSGEFVNRETTQILTNGRLSEHFSQGEAVDPVTGVPHAVDSPLVNWMPKGNKEPVNLYKSFPKEVGGLKPELLQALVEKFRGTKAAPPAKGEFELFKDGLPQAYRGMAKVLYDQKKQNEKMVAQRLAVASPWELSQSVGQGLPPHLYAMDTRVYEPGMFGPDPRDIKSTKAGRLFTPGGSMYYMMKDNVPLKWAVDTINHSKNWGEAKTYRALADPKHGLFPQMKALGKEGSQRVFATVLDNNGLRELTREELVRDGFTNAEIALHENLREMLNTVANDIDIVRHEKGMTPIRRYPGYFPASWSGKYYVEVKRVDGTTVAFEAAHRREHLEGLRKRAESNGFQVSEIFEKAPDRSGEKGDFKYRPLFDQIAETLGRDSFERVAFDEIVNQYYSELGYNRRGFKKHVDERKTGVGGYRGKRGHMTPKENYADSIGSLEGYVRDAYDWMATQRAFKELSAFERDMGQQKKLDNVRQFMREYWDHAQGNENKMMALTREISDYADYLAEKATPGWLPKPLQLGGGTTASALAGIKEVLMVKMLGGWRLSFLVPNRLQSIQMMPAAIMELRVRQPNPNYKHGGTMALTKGFLDSQTYQMGLPVDGLIRDAMTYAEQAGIVHPRFLSEVRRQRNLSVGRNIWEWVSGLKGINMVEQMARMDAYLQSVRSMEGTLTGKQLFEASRNMTDQAMTNYRQHERAQVFQRMGGVGAMASPLQTFKFNYFAQQLKYMKLALDNPTNIKAYGPALMATATQLLFGGLTGMILLKEVDLVGDLLKAAGLMNADTDFGSAWIMKKTAALQRGNKNFIRYGVWSSMSGAQASPHFALSQIIPHSADDALALPGAGWELAGDLMNATKYLAQGTPRAAAATAGANLPGGPAKGLEEFSRTSPQGVLQNPERGMEGSVPRNPNQPDPYRMAGTRSIPEAESMDAMRRSEQKAQQLAQQRAKISDTYIRKYMEGQPVQAELNAYVQAGGMPKELIEKLVAKLVASQTTAWQRKETKLQSIQSLREHLDRMEYDVRK